MKRIFNYKLEKNRKSACRLFSRRKRPNYHRDVNHFLSLSLSGINERQMSRCIEKHLSKNLVVADVPLCGACGRNPISCDYHCIISKGHIPSNTDILETVYFFHESAFHPHETSESGHQNRIVLKPLFRVV